MCSSNNEAEPDPAARTLFSSLLIGEGRRREGAVGGNVVTALNQHNRVLPIFNYIQLLFNLPRNASFVREKCEMGRSGFQARTGASVSPLSVIPHGGDQMDLSTFD